MTKRRIGGSGFEGGYQDAKQAARQATGQKDTAKAGRYYRKSYLLTRELIDQVKETADAQGVGISEFVRWALTRTIDGVNAGDIEIPTETTEVKRIILD